MLAVYEDDSFGQYFQMRQTAATSCTVIVKHSWVACPTFTVPTTELDLSLSANNNPVASLLVALFSHSIYTKIWVKGTYKVFKWWQYKIQQSAWTASTTYWAFPCIYMFVCIVCTHQLSQHIHNWHTHTRTCTVPLSSSSLYSSFLARICTVYSTPFTLEAKPSVAEKQKRQLKATDRPVKAKGLFEKKFNISMFHTRKAMSGLWEVGE